MFAKWRLRKRVEAVEPLTAATRDGGIARVKGTVKPLDTTLHAPASGRVCVAFSVRVHEPKVGDATSFEPNSPFDCVELAPFAITHQRRDDGADEVVIDSRFGELVGFPEYRARIMHDVHWTTFCDARALSPSSTGVERAVFAGMTVTVVGTVQRRSTVPGREAGFRDTPQRLCLIGDFDHPLLVLAAGAI